MKKLPFQKAVFEYVSNTWLVTQAQCYQIAKRKIPDWWAKAQVVFPDPQAVEQASSEWLARWKQTLIPPQVDTLVDLSTGLGVDAYFIGKRLKKSILIDPDLGRAKILEENFKRFGVPGIQVESTDALSFIQKNLHLFGPNTLVYVDPDRRTEDSQRITSWKETQPDLNQIITLLKPTGTILMAKLSPLDDLEEIATELPDIQQIFTISLQKEVKEILVFLNFLDQHSEVEKYAVEISRSGMYRTLSVDRQTKSPKSLGTFQPGHYLFDPWASIRKGYQTALLPEQFPVQLFSPHSQIFVGMEMLLDFPGRVFRIDAVLPSLRAFGQEYKGQVFSVISRGMVESAESIKKKFKLRDGGDRFFFCLQSIDNQIYYICATRIETSVNPALWHSIPADSD